MVSYGFILECIWSLVHGSADQISILLPSFAGFICGSRIMYFVSAHIVEDSIQGAFNFISYLIGYCLL